MVPEMLKCDICGEKCEVWRMERYEGMRHVCPVCRHDAIIAWHKNSDVKAAKFSISRIMLELIDSRKNLDRSDLEDLVAVVNTLVEQISEVKPTRPAAPVCPYGCELTSMGWKARSSAICPVHGTGRKP
jgi:ssDNA-binding Zn-finger/Zn-ribbon topoisomerase 1